VQDDSTFTNPLLIMALGERNTEDSRRKGLATKAGIQRRAERGHFVGGRPPYGYTPEGEPDPIRAAVVRRIFTEYTEGVGQRGIARALNAEGVRGPAGGTWRQSRITAILRNPAYLGRVPVKGDDGELLRGEDGELGLPGKHEPLIEREVWGRAHEIRTAAHRRRGGRHADGGHLLTRGLLRCGQCGAAMNPRKARQGVERERYRCSGRVADRTSCSQPSIGRERIDVPLLAALLDRHVDLEKQCSGGSLSACRRPSRRRRKRR
jgi:site-specific DNA recombinase